VRSNFERRNVNLANRFRSKLGEFYGEEKAAQIKCAEAFEICEYGTRPDKARLRQLFPFFEP